MINFLTLFFNENFLLLRNLIFIFGWVVLILSSIVLIYKSTRLYKKIKHLVFGKLIIPIIVGWLITMYSLGTVSTFYILDMPKKGMLVSFPIFLIWIIIIVSVFLITSKWGTEAMNKYNDMVRMNKELQKANTRLQQLDEFKSEFVTIITHQSRTPLTGTKWALNSLINGDLGILSKEQKEILKRVYDSNERAIKIIDNLLESEKINVINREYNFKKDSIEKIAEDVVDDFSLTAKHKKINMILIRPQKNIPDIVMDSLRIRMAMSILIENALNYTERGEVKVILENTDNYVKVSVTDTGVGISEDEKDRIFTRFFRGKKAMSIQTDGTGLGLFIAKNIIEIHGGEIWLESEEGKGATFYFILPVKPEK